VQQRRAHAGQEPRRRDAPQHRHLGGELRLAQPAGAALEALALAALQPEQLAIQDPAQVVEQRPRRRFLLDRTQVRRYDRERGQLRGGRRVERRQRRCGVVEDENSIWMRP
jgi:hypothetical protein